MAVIELVTSAWAFWKATGAVFRAANARTTSDSKDNRMKEALLHLPFARVTWLCSLFLFGYVGAEVALGGWIVKFMLEVRHGAPFGSGMTATGFWMGITVGRIVLGFVTPRLGEKLAIAVSFSKFLFASPPFDYGIVLIAVEKLLTLSCIDIPPPCHGAGINFLARPFLLRLRRCRIVPRLLSWPLIPRRRGRCNQAFTAPLTC